jgi:xylulokinase
MLVSSDGKVLAESQVEHPVSVPRPGWSEQHPELWWRSTVQAIHKALHTARSIDWRGKIAAIGISGQMHSSVFLDTYGEVIRPALLWNDVRTSAECRHILQDVGLDLLRNTVGNLPLEGFTAPKLLWLRENEPENYARLHTLLLPKDYIRYRMSGEFATDPSDAAGTLLYDVHRRDWAESVLQTLQLDADILPSVVESSEISGTVTAEAAAELGVKPGIPIVGGGADNAAGAVGCGATDSSIMQVSIGTSGAVVTPTNEPRVAPDMNLHTFCHAAPNLWYLMGVVLSAGSALRWLRDSVAAEQPYDRLTAKAESVPAGSDGLIFLPYLTGERTPHNDANARGVFFGLNFAHDIKHLTRAVIEGVCFAMRDSLELMKEQSISPSEVRLIGGGARSRMWLQTLSNVFGLPISTVQPAGGAAYGAALLAAAGCGMFTDIEEAVKSCIRTEGAVEPNADQQAAYEELYGAYKRLYPALKEEFAFLSALTAGQE